MGVIGRVGRRGRLGENVGSIEVILPGNANQRKQRIATRVGEGRSHPMRSGHLADGAHRPVRRNPFAGGMR